VARSPSDRESARGRREVQRERFEVPASGHIVGQALKRRVGRENCLDDVWHDFVRGVEDHGRKLAP
jgi:hypothetical protein